MSLLMNVQMELEQKGFDISGLRNGTKIIYAVGTPKEGRVAVKLLALDPSKIKPSMVMDKNRILKPLTELYSLGVFDITKGVFEALKRNIRHPQDAFYYNGGISLIALHAKHPDYRPNELNLALFDDFYIDGGFVDDLIDALWNDFSLVEYEGRKVHGIELARF